MRRTVAVVARARRVDEPEPVSAGPAARRGWIRASPAVLRNYVGLVSGGASVAATAAAAVAIVAAGVAWAAPPEVAAPPAPPPVYANPALGLTVKGPAGWTLVEDREAGQGWVRLFVLSDKASGAETVASVRKARAGTLLAMRADLRKLFGADPSFSVSATTDVPPTPARPFGGVRVEGTQTTPAPPRPSGPPLPPVVVRFRWMQFLGNGQEWLLYSTVRATVYSRVADAIQATENGFTLASDAAAARGEGLFRDEEAGFSCRFPAGYGVRVPDRKQHVVEFSPSGEGPVLGVYRYESPETAEAEADALVAYYTGDEVQGEAEKGLIDLAGRSAYLVKAKGRVEGRDQVFFVAVVKRGSETTFRLRVAADPTREDVAKAAFDAFLKSFALLNG